MFYTLIGLIAGIIGGMGLGGGTVLIPALVLLAGIDTKIAQSVNLLASIPMTLVALLIHIKNKNVIIKIVIPIALFGILGAMFGSLLSTHIKADILKRLFGIFLLIVGFLEIKKGFSKT
ncbi:MAG: sulfite exporter TauE/SafE family protein [Clostridioides difficile]|nr:sulfite exporter TauE/SafE family protein [Clostridioides sp.]MBS5786667.1 sulfite exporter TauE/SafE family protein [Clostridioides difficile]